MKTRMSMLMLLISSLAFSQTPEITSWLQNTSETGSYYMQGNGTPIDNGIIHSCQEVSYSANYVYIKTHGIPSYTTGPFLDGNPSLAEDQNAIFQFPRNPQPASNNVATTMGNIGVLIDGTAVFDNRDGVQWDPSSNALCGGPGNPPCPGGPGATMAWSRDAVWAEKSGFDCSKGHPAMGNYHHHQNPSAFKLDLTVISTICNMYDADGLYAIDSTQHSPLLGFAYDGYPIYGAYGYKNSDGTGGVTRIRSGYELANYSVRTHYPDGTDVDDGPAVDGTYFLGYFREDYYFVAHPGQEEYLDEHNGRFCVTPEYPAGTYAYFTTVDENWNSYYPYAVGPTFYGQWADRLVSSISESVTVYTPTNELDEQSELKYEVYPNPANDLLAIQVKGLLKEAVTVDLVDMTGRILMQSTINAGQTIAFFDVETLYAGNYVLVLNSGATVSRHNVVIE